MSPTPFFSPFFGVGRCNAREKRRRVAGSRGTGGGGGVQLHWIGAESGGHPPLAAWLRGAQMTPLGYGVLNCIVGRRRSIKCSQTFISTTCSAICLGLTTSFSARVDDFADVQLRITTTSLFAHTDTRCRPKIALTHRSNKAPFFKRRPSY